MVHGNNEYWLKTMDLQKPYYFSIEAINENGI
jgi:xylan 1,4-beta-xylosidase